MDCLFLQQYNIHSVIRVWVEINPEIQCWFNNDPLQQNKSLLTSPQAWLTLHPVTYLEPITPYNQQHRWWWGAALFPFYMGIHMISPLPFKHPWTHGAPLQGSHNGGNASSVRKNDSQNKKTKPIHHLMQSVIVLQPEHRTDWLQTSWHLPMDCLLYYYK